MTATLMMRRADRAGSHTITPRRLLIAGFTGRDAAAVSEHVEELRALGVPVPDEVPTLLELDPALLTTEHEITVSGAFTSGEIEPVLVVADGVRLLTAGSDHTDRDVERQSIARAKEICPKVLSDTCVGLESIGNWDAIELTSWAGGEAEPYQRGTLGELLPLSDVMALLSREGTALQDGDVLFLGTVPVRGGLRPARKFRGLLRLPSGVELGLAYDIRQVAEATTVEEG